MMQNAEGYLATAGKVKERHPCHGHSNPPRRNAHLLAFKRFAELLGHIQACIRSPKGNTVEMDSERRTLLCHGVRKAIKPTLTEQ